jgi:hypothetical protein
MKTHNKNLLPDEKVRDIISRVDNYSKLQKTSFNVKQKNTREKCPISPVNN